MPLTSATKRSIIPLRNRPEPWPPPGIPGHYHPATIARDACRWCRGSGYSRVNAICTCVKRAVEKELSRCRDKWERLYVESLRFPANFPHDPVPQSSWGRRFVRAGLSKENLRHY